MIVIGVTGGVGTGKSTVARMFERMGAERFDADETAHRSMEPGAAAWRKIRTRFGADVLDARGRIDRKKLGRIVFASPARLKALNRIVHPEVRRRIRGGLKELKRRRPGAVAVLDIPLLMESEGAYPVNALVVVWAPAAKAAGRLRKRSGWTAREMKRRGSFQMSLREKVKHADFVVRNGGSLAQTRRQAVRIWKKITGEGVHGRK